MSQPFPNKSNVDILNAIRNQASTDYQRRVPAATKANVQDVVQNIVNVGTLRNEAYDALVNRIALVVARDRSWNNPLKKFKKGFLPYGSTVEEIQVGLLQSKVYDPSREYLEHALFGKEKPDVQTSFHTINRQEMYKVTIEEQIIRRAFLDEFGLSSLVNQLQNAMTTSDEWDEYLLTVNLFTEFYQSDGFWKVQVPDVSNTSSGEEEAKALLRRIREMSAKLQFISEHYNASKMPVSAAPDELVLFTTTQANSAMDVEALAGAFNMEKADIPTRTLVLPDEHMAEIPGLQAILTTENFFQIYDTLYETRSQANPAGLYDNYFLHHHQIISLSRFVPAILFTTQAGDSITVVETPVQSVEPIVVQDTDFQPVSDVTRGNNHQVVSYAITNPAGGVNNAVRFEISGHESERTYISQTGTLHIALDESAEQITITAIATTDNSVVATLTIDVVGELVEWFPPSIVVEPEAPEQVVNAVTIPEIDGVIYQVDGEPVSGVLNITEDTTVTAVPDNGYSFPDTATSSWFMEYAE